VVKEERELYGRLGEKNILVEINVDDNSWEARKKGAVEDSTA